MFRAFLSPVTLLDLDELLAFELANRQFFEERINARPSSYYDRYGVRAAIEAANDDRTADKGYQYLIRDGAGRLVGRVNLVRVRREHFHSAELGYRIAQAELGKGYAGEAVRQVLAKAFAEHRLVRVEAATRPENLGSVKVLLRNGFTEFGRSRRSFQLAGVWYDTVHYERRSEAAD